MSTAITIYNTDGSVLKRIDNPKSWYFDTANHNAVWITTKSEMRGAEPLAIMTTLPILIEKSED